MEIDVRVGLVNRKDVPHEFVDDRGETHVGIFSTREVSAVLTQSADIEAILMQMAKYEKPILDTLNDILRASEQRFFGAPHKESDRHGTSAWYAKEIYVRIRLLLDELTPHSTLEARNFVSAAFDLGRIVERANFAEKHQGATIRGNAILRSAGLGGQAKSSQQRALICKRNIVLQRQADEMWSGRPSLTKSAVASAIHKRLAGTELKDVSQQTIRKAIRRPLPPDVLSYAIADVRR